ncbi:helix-turn-helix domain-containing protein [Streptomyces sp. NPDC002159]
MVHNNQRLHVYHLWCHARRPAPRRGLPFSSAGLAPAADRHSTRQPGPRPIPTGRAGPALVPRARLRALPGPRRRRLPGHRARIARETGLHLDTVRTWRNRFAEQGLAGLADRKRTRWPRAFTALQTAQVKALACQLPAESGVPLSRWSCPDLAREAVARGIAAFVSASTVRRWLAEDALKPWQHRSWIFITDPDFRTRAQRVLDLYARTWQGMPLGTDEYVISADEKTSIQARCRCHPTLAPGRARAMRSTTPTAAAAPWPTWPPTTSTKPRCTAAPSPRPASTRS